MKTRTDIHAGAGPDQVGLPNPISQCKAEKEYWKNQYDYMQRVLANCRPSPGPTPGPTPGPKPIGGGGWVGGVWYADRSGICG